MAVPNGLGFSAKHSVRTLHSKPSEHVLSYVVAAKFITHLYYSFISSQAISAENMPSFDTGTRPDFYLKDQMVSRCKYESSSEVGAYARITNSFVLLPLSASPQFAQPFLQMDLPVVRCNIAGTAIVGRLTVGNKHGIIVPCTTTHAELATLRESLPDGVAIEQVEERLSALGNVISCNDKVALVHPELDAETIAVIEDVLQVQTFPAMIANEPVVGSYSVFTLFITIALLVDTPMGLEESFRLASFQVATAQTTTGFGTADYMLWPSCTWLVLCIAMMVGACAGSTTGAMKSIRLAMLFKIVRNQFRHMLHPNAVLPLRISGVVISNEIKTTLLAFFFAYIGIILVGWVFMLTLGVGFMEAFGITVSSLGNVGPGLGNCGPAYSWNNLPDAAKWGCSFLMLIGRLELFSVLLLFSPSFWKKH